MGSYNALRAAVEHGITRICQASSVNAIGLSYSRAPRFDYFPIDEQHPNYSEEPYGLSKWICEQQADTFARRYEDIRIASMRFHWVVPDRATAGERFNAARAPRSTSGPTRCYEAAARACLLSLDARFTGPRGLLHRGARHDDRCAEPANWPPNTSRMFRSAAISAGTEFLQLGESRAAARLEHTTGTCSESGRAALTARRLRRPHAENAT